MKTLAFFRLTLVAAALALTLPQGVALAQSTGQPRDAAVAGDVPAAALSEAEIANLRTFARVYTVARWFHPSDAALAADWDALAIEAIPQVIAAGDERALAAVLESVFAPIVEHFEASAEPLGPYAGPANANGRWQWIHNGFQGIRQSGYSKFRREIGTLGQGPIFEEQLGGVHVRFPLTGEKLGDEHPSAEPRTTFSGRPEGWTPAGFDRTTRIAATIIGWGVLDQFYPYWDVVDVDWDTKLGPQLQRAAMAEDDVAFHDALRLMMHEIEDGHGGAQLRWRDIEIAPVALEHIEDKIVVAWARPETGIRAGSVVSSIDGVDAGELMHRFKSERASGSEHFRTMRALAVMIEGEPGTRAQFSLVEPDGTEREVEVERVAYTRENWPEAPRPEPVSQIEPGIVYVDPSRVTDEELIAQVDLLSGAQGLVFDLRGRPRGSSFFLSHLTDELALSARMERPVIERPDQQGVSFSEGGWRMQPLLPRLTSNTVFLSNATAVSYPESVLGVVKGNALGTIVGQASAGANGNVTLAGLPGGYRIMFTGMRVVNQDGSVHHNIGVVPDVIVEPTIAGLAAGRDEILEAGLAIVREGLSQP
ncbi:S41 family peptidase [Erythrobacter sp. KY5]|uniref:S41 family peptidase n=1 Tax=Erythrobacter sp. KY5 TaxID=2011159 RepID=UPI0013A70823|nr:S41 family peptidase [Erythrobacter sp. KY5]